jgi:putative nucleotidyltransferase with HDIG domain
MGEAIRILLISDDEALSKYIKDKLISIGEFNVLVVSLRNAPKIIHEQGFDIIIINFSLANNFENINLIKEIRKIDPDSIIIALTDELTGQITKDFSRLGVYDSIVKPINIDKLFFLIRKGIDLRSLMVAHRKLVQSFQEQNLSLQKQNTLLAKRIEESTKNLTRLYEDLRQTYMRTIKVLAQAIDARDHYTHSHSENVSRYAVVISEELGLSTAEIEKIREACELHDLGKIGVADNILTKPSSLTPEEWAEIKRHPLTGAQILEPLTFLNEVIDIVKQHHEHYDGSGYPLGLKGEEILLGAKIVHLADAYETMRSARSYRKIPLTKEEAITEIKKNSGTQFDPKVTAAFLKVVDKL